MELEDRADSRQYNLSEKQLAYLLEADISKRREGNLKPEIKDVIKRLDERLRYLIEDIGIFHASNDVGLEGWDDAWESLSEIDRQDELYDPPLFIRGSPVDDQDYLDLAVHLGHIARILYQDTAPEFQEEKIAMGFLLGLQGEFLKEWSDPSGTDIFHDPLPEGDTFPVLQMPDDETIRDLRRIMREVQSHVGQESPPGIGAELRNRLEDSNLTLTTSLARRAKEQVEDSEYPQEYVIDSKVGELEDDAQLLAAEELIDQIEQDIDVLSSSKYRKANAIDVFISAYRAGENTTVADIREGAGTKRHQVKKFLNDLTGRDPPWDERPILSEYEDFYTVTAYGELFGHLLTPEDALSTPSDSDYTIPSRVGVASRCHRYLFGYEGEENQDLVESILQDQFPEISTDKSS